MDDTMGQVTMLAVTIRLPSTRTCGAPAGALSLSFTRETFLERSRGLRGSVTALPFAEGAFDCVVCSQVIEHV
ncbi:MAG TPA: methyltransferase domain-containing protein, partial [Gaiellaceae bacterium]|nr:methyltransferase domain-containing protein [Gaiellaceae bacterium]